MVGDMKFDEYVEYLEEIRKTTEYQERHRQLWAAPPSATWTFHEDGTVTVEQHTHK